MADVIYCQLLFLSCLSLLLALNLVVLLAKKLVDFSVK